MGLVYTHCSPNLEINPQGVALSLSDKDPVYRKDTFSHGNLSAEDFQIHLSDRNPELLESLHFVIS